MANLSTPKITTIEVHSQYAYYFELDADNYRIRVKAYDRDVNKDRIEGTMRETEWIEMLDENGNPNLPVEDWAVFAQALPLVTALVVAFGKKGGIIDPDAVVSLG